MTEIRPFRALRYDPEQVELGQVLVPPYDVITPGEREQLYDRDPHCAIRLELTRDPADEATTDYGYVTSTLAEWRDAGVLRLDARPALYALRQRFVAPGGEHLARDGFFALLHLEDYERGIVRPHERTLTGPKADRLKMLRATRANLSSVFLLYEDPQQSLSKAISERLDAGPGVSARDAAGVEQILVPIDDTAFQDQVRSFLRERPVVIADGHHRYETALSYRNERRRQRRLGDERRRERRLGDERRRAAPDDPFEFALAYFANAYAPGSLLLPIHRVVRQVPAPDDAGWQAKLPGWESRSVPMAGAAEIPELLETHLAPLADRPAFAADDGSGALRLFWREPRQAGELAVRALHGEVLDGVFGLDDDAVREGAVAFPKSALEAAREVRAGRGTTALYLNPLSPDDVFRVTGAGEILPQKSTYFHPKLPSGLLFRLLDEDGA